MPFDNLNESTIVKFIEESSDDEDIDNADDFTYTPENVGADDEEGSDNILCGWAGPKGCVCYIFASLFCLPKREDLWNKEKCFLFHFGSSFRSWDNQILIFQIFKFHDVIKCLSMKRETHLLNTWEANAAW